MISSLGYIGIESPAFDEWEGFAVEVLGMQASRQPDGSVVHKMDDWHHRVTIHPGERDRLAYIGYEVPTRTALSDLDERLRAGGFDVVAQDEATRQTRHVGELLRFTDPAGFVTELYCAMELSPDSFRPSRAAFLTGDGGLGHMVVVVPDAGTYATYLTELLGFRLSDELARPGVPGKGQFFHCNGRHHTLAIAERAGSRGLHHLMIEVADIDGVGRTYDIALQRDLVAMTLGRHTNDRMFSFYLRTPSAFLIEYGWGGITIDDATWVVATHTESALWGHDKTGPQPVALEPA